MLGRKKEKEEGSGGGKESDEMNFLRTRAVSMRALC